MKYIITTERESREQEVRKINDDGFKIQVG
jgi:hypothetical protein